MGDRLEKKAVVKKSVTLLLCADLTSFYIRGVGGTFCENGYVKNRLIIGLVGLGHGPSMLMGLDNEFLVFLTQSLVVLRR